MPNCCHSGGILSVMKTFPAELGVIFSVMVTALEHCSYQRESSELLELLVLLDLDLSHKQSSEHTREQITIYLPSIHTFVDRKLNPR
jgi:hypothetical protein